MVHNWNSALPLYRDTGFDRKMQYNKYNTISEGTIDDLKGIVGEKYIIYNDIEKLALLSHDETPDSDSTGVAECVVFPESSKQISDIIKLSNKKRFPVTPRGAGTGLSEGAVPVYGGLVMLFDRMNRIIDYDRHNLTITTQPGLITNELNKHTREDSLFFAGYPMSLESCSIGGNVAENSGGGKAIKYGVTGKYVIGLEVVTPTGDIMVLGGKIQKDVTGYNLIGLMVGSEGTLCIFTSITLKLLAVPNISTDLFVLFNSTEEAISAVPKIIIQSGTIPAAIEYMDQISVKTTCKYLGETIPYENAAAFLLINLEGNDRSIIDSDCERIGEICMNAGATEILVGDTPSKSEKLWKVRRNIAEAFKSISPHQSIEDIVVPAAAIPDMALELEKIGKKNDILIPVYGHAGDGNLHPTIVMNPGWTIDEWRNKQPLILSEIYLTATKLGGKISGEHGIGSKRKKYMKSLCQNEYINAIRAIKKSFDPNNILNPGKIFDY